MDLLPDAESAVCFTGHRYIGRELLPGLTSKLDVVIDRCIDKGLTSFLAGGAIGFDTLAALRVTEAKLRHPRAKLYLILPCRDQTKLWKSLCDINEYRRLKECADGIVYIQDFYDKNCMMKRNMFLVDHSSICIAYFDGKSGGTGNTVKYAAECGKKIINLYNADAQDEKNA